jgi:hypothetical protein
MIVHRQHYKSRNGIKRMADAALLWNRKRCYRSNATRARLARSPRDKQPKLLRITAIIKRYLKGSFFVIWQRTDTQTSNRHSVRAHVQH